MKYHDTLARMIPVFSRASRNAHRLITAIIMKAIAILNRLCGSHSVPIVGRYAITIRSLNTVRIFWKTNSKHSAASIGSTGIAGILTINCYFLSIADRPRACTAYELATVTKTRALLTAWNRSFVTLVTIHEPSTSTSPSWRYVDEQSAKKQILIGQL